MHRCRIGLCRRRTSGLQRTRDGRSCLHFHTLSPVPLRPGINRRYAASSSKNVVGAFLLADRKALAGRPWLVLLLGTFRWNWMAMSVLDAGTQRTASHILDSARRLDVSWLRLVPCPLFSSDRSGAHGGIIATLGFCFLVVLTKTRPDTSLESSLMAITCPHCGAAELHTKEFRHKRILSSTHYLLGIITGFIGVLIWYFSLESYSSVISADRPFSHGHPLPKFFE